MSSHTLSDLLTQPWVVDAQQAETLLLPLIKQSIEGNGLAMMNTAKAEPENQVQVADESLIVPGYFSGFESPDIPENSIAVIPITGFITKYYVWWMESTSSLRTAELVRQAEANSRIKGLLFQVDGPGGTFYGIQSMADAIYNCTKPTLAYINDGYAFSGHAWAAFPADQVWMSHDTDQIGSIGVYTEITDYSGMYEEMKIVTHSIYADQSTEKNLDVKEALKGNYKPIKDRNTNPMAQAFIDAVTLYRGDRLNLAAGDPMKGDIYMYEQALAIGLVDAKGTLEEALQYLSAQSTSSSTISNYKSESDMNLKDWITGSKSGEEDGDKDVTIKGSELQELRTSVQNANKELETEKGNVKTLTDEKTQLTADLKTKGDALTAMTTERDEWKEKAEKLGAKPGTSHGYPLKEGSEGGDIVEGDEPKTEAEVNAAFVHNNQDIEDSNFI